MQRRNSKLPEAVRQAVEKLKKGRKYGVVAVKIKGSYYAYEYKDWTDRTTGRRHEEKLYIGKINPDGTFVRKVANRLPGRPIDLEQYMQMKYKEPSAIVDRATMPNALDMALLTQMSVDGRASASNIAEKLGISSAVANYRIEKLEKTYDIWPTLNLRPTIFGFSRFLILVKFLAGRPAADAMKEVLEKEQKVQLTLLMKGDHDMMIYVIAEDIPALETMLYRIRSDKVFADCKSIWNVSYLYEAFGWIVPNRDLFFELIKSRVWHRTQETPRKLPNQLLYSEYAVMKELSKNCKADFSSIDDAHGLNKGSAQYTYHRLVERKIIEGTTICMRNPHAKYSVFIYLEQDDIVAFNKTKAEYFKILVGEPKRPTNRFVYVADVSSPYGIVVIAPIYNDSELEELLEMIKEKIKGINVTYSIITNQLIGKIGFRKFDMTKTRSYKLSLSL